MYGTFNNRSQGGRRVFGDIDCNIWGVIVAGIHPDIKRYVLPTDSRYYDIRLSRKLISQTIDRKEASSLYTITPQLP